MANVTSRAQLCATVTGNTTAELRANRDAACEKGEADLVELRVDTVPDLDLEGALGDRPCPVLVTCRPTWEGGHFRGSEEERHRILRRALALGADWVDLEWRGGLDALIAERQGRNIVLSTHDFDETPDDLEDRHRAMRATGAAVVKIAVRSRSGADVVRLLHGLPPLIEGVAAEPKRLEDPPRHHIQIRGPGGGAQTVELSPDGRDVLRSTIGDAEGTVLELVYEDHGAGPGKLRIPRRTEVRAPRQGRVVKLRILEIAATRPKPEAFSTECPAGLLVEPLPCGPAAVTPR